MSWIVTVFSILLFSYLLTSSPIKEGSTFKKNDVLTHTRSDDVIEYLFESLVNFTKNPEHAIRLYELRRVRARQMAEDKLSRLPHKARSVALQEFGTTRKR